jgi:hypothetical protein
MPGWYSRLRDIVWSSVAAWFFALLGIVEAVSSNPSTDYVLAVGFAAVANAVLSLRE